MISLLRLKEAGFRCKAISVLTMHYLKIKLCSTDEILSYSFGLDFHMLCAEKENPFEQAS